MENETHEQRILRACKDFLHRDVSDLVRNAFNPAVISPGDLKDNERWIRADTFRCEAIPIEGVDYEWVWAYARESIERAFKIYGDLDNKANELIKYLGGGAGILAAASLLTIQEDHAWIYLWFAPALLSSLVSVFFAVLASKPNPVSLPPSIQDALNIASIARVGERGRAAMIGPLHLVYESLLIANEIKAARVQRATWWFFSTLTMLLVTMLGVAVRLISL